MAISPMKHTWAKGILDRMENNTWFPHVVNMADDVASYNRLNAADRFMFDKALAFLSNLDGIQFNNINQNIAKHVTSPEVAMCLSRQAWEEALHVKSYATIIETVSLDPMSVYMTFERDGLLAQKTSSFSNSRDYSVKNSRLKVLPFHVYQTSCLKVFISSLVSFRSICLPIRVKC